MRRVVFGIAAAAILPCTEPLPAQGIGDSPVAWTAGQVGEIVQSMGQLRGQRAAFERQIRNAREAYFTAQASGQGLAEAEKEFAALLFDKDFFYLSMYVPEGPNSDHAEGLIRVAMGGHVDGGIPAPARREYDAWVQKIRRDLGAKSPDELIFVLNQQRAIDAIIGAQEEYRTYKRARDRAELSARGLAVAGAEATSSAPVSQQVAEAAQRREQDAYAFRDFVETLFAQRYGGEEPGRQARYGFGAGFGPNRFEAAARRVFDAAKDASGKLQNPAQLGVDATLRDPHDALQAILLKEHVAPYALEWLIISSRPNGTIADAGHAWGELIITFGEHAVLETARAINTAPKAAAAGGATRVANPRALGGWSPEPDRLLREVLTFGSTDGFLLALMSARAASAVTSVSAQALRDDLVKQHGAASVRRAADILRAAMIQRAGTTGPAELSNASYEQLVAALGNAPGARVVMEFAEHDRTGGEAGNIVVGANDVLYGTASRGGARGHGFTFRVNHDGSGYAVLHEFAGDQTDGRSPLSLVLGRDGMLYGTLGEGGAHNGGSAFRLKPDGTGFTVLRHFNPQSEGVRARLVSIDASGALYGISNADERTGLGGRIFRMSNAGASFAVVYESGNEMERSQLNLQRTMRQGHVQQMQAMVDGARAQGATTQLPGYEQQLAEAKAGLAAVDSAIASARLPVGPVVDGEDGWFYGVVFDRLFRVRRDGSGFATLRRFEGPPNDARTATAPPVLGADGKLYGATADGGTANSGIIYSLNRDGSGYRVIFNPQEPFAPGRIVAAPGGVLYGIGMAQPGVQNLPRLYRLSVNGDGFTVLDQFENNPRIVQTTELRFHDGAIVGVARWGNGGAQLFRWRP